MLMQKLAAQGFWKGKRVSLATVKKKTEFQGIPLHIDRPAGFVMSGEDKQGKPWSRTYKVDYGFIPRTDGGDGDGVDVFLGPDADAHTAFWAAQKKDDGSFDEWKVFLGFASKQAARKTYVDHIPADKLIRITALSVEIMRSMLGMPAASSAKVAGFCVELGSLLS